MERVCRRPSFCALAARRLPSRLVRAKRSSRPCAANPPLLAAGDGIEIDAQGDTKGMSAPGSNGPADAARLTDVPKSTRRPILSRESHLGDFAAATPLSRTSSSPGAAVPPTKWRRHRQDGRNLPSTCYFITMKMASSRETHGQPVLIEYSELLTTEPATATSANLYIKSRWRASRCSFATLNHSKSGILVKTRAAENYILYKPPQRRKRRARQLPEITVPNGGETITSAT